MYKLLIASNQQPWRDHARSLFVTRGFHLCGEAQNLDQTLLLAELNLPDVILFNFRCSLRNQLNLISTISELGSSVKVLVFSPNLIRRSIWSYICAGACALALPNINDDEFIKIVHATLAGFTMTPINRPTEVNPKMAHDKNK